ncbi:hypothetical protein VNO80_05421 [Phaseolus coccineus]|uniref:Uncharacterized protein n=1 Tax=Phaseolus coccineus TaxID=3886 RepID=A0AAN9NJT0_PHACN
MWQRRRIKHVDFIELKRWRRVHVSDSNETDSISQTMLRDYFCMKKAFGLWAWAGTHLIEFGSVITRLGGWVKAKGYRGLECFPLSEVPILVKTLEHSH